MSPQANTGITLVAGLRSISLPADDTVARLRPYDDTPRTTQGEVAVGGTRGVLRQLRIAPVEATRRPVPGVHSLPIQIWEGTVTGVDHDADTFDAMLDAKFGIIPRHTATISFEWVPAQDLSLVSLGAVFYLTLYKESERSSVKNAQEIRFRRLPSWSKHQLQRVRNDAALFLENIEA